MNSVKGNEFFIPDDNGSMHPCLSIIDVLEALSIDPSTKKRLSKHTPRCSEAFMRIEAKELEVAYSTYYRELKALEDMPLEKQLPEIFQLFQSISSQYDPPMYCEDAWDIADELSSPEWIDERDENPPFSSFIFQEPDRNLVMIKAKMLYLYREIRDQLRFKLQYITNKRKHMILNTIKINERQENKTIWKGPDEKTMKWRNLGKMLEEWYEDYCERIVHYPTCRQINALLNMRKMVLANADWAEGSPRMGDNADEIHYLIFSNPKENYIPRLRDFGNKFVRNTQGEKREMAWEDFIPEEIGHNMTFAEFAYFFFCSALNYEIDRLKDVMLYDEPYEDMIGDVNEIMSTEQHQTTDNKTPLPIPKALNTQRAQKYFQKAIEKGYMKVEKNNFLWLGVGLKGKKSQLAYFCGLVYEYKNSINGNSGIAFPEKELNTLFKVTRLYSLLTQVYNAQKPQNWRTLIDELFE